MSDAETVGSVTGGQGPDPGAASLPPGVVTCMTTLAHGLAAILGQRLLGLYLGGSATMGGFEPVSSDLDFLAVLDGPLTAGEAEAIETLHDRLRREVAYGDRLEGDYAPRQVLVPEGTTEPTPGCWDGRFVPQFQDIMLSADNLASLLDHGIAFHGPEPRELLPQVSPDHVRAAARAMLEEEPEESPTAEQAASEILNDLRSLRSIHTGAPSTKDDGAAWAVQRFPPRWHRTIRAALAIRRRAGSAEDERVVLQDRSMLHAAALEWLRDL